MPSSEEAQVEELRWLLALGSPEIVGSNGHERIALPSSIYKALKEVVNSLQRGRTILMVVENEELTTQTAANFLGVSRPHLIKLLESGCLPFHRTGSHRRILFNDLMVYAKKRDVERKVVLGEFAKEGFVQRLYDSVAIPEDGEDA